GFLSLLSILGAGVGKIIRRQGGVRAFSRWFMGALLMAGLLSGCGPLGEAPWPSEETPPPGTPAAASGLEQPVGVVTPSPTPTAPKPPAPPTPGPVPTPRPLILPSAEEVRKQTAHWKVFEDPELGLRFRYPAEYEIRIQPISRQQGGLSIDRPTLDPHWGEIREIFIGMRVFLLEGKDPRLTTPEGLETWVRELPEGENPIPGGGPIRVVEKLQVGGRPAFVIQEPLWPGDSPKVQSLIVIGKERVLWISLGDTMYLNPERAEKLWPQQMIWLATLEVIR
ncbi:MAG TPA: hypothetical protein VNK89_02655, partial [Thermoflexus sp.]|nr:hypothetical protein [Thermoflexus sp.]